MMNQIVFSFIPVKPINFLEATDITFNPKKCKGINGYLWLYFDMHPYRGMYDVYFSIDGKLCKILGLEDPDGRLRIKIMDDDVIVDESDYRKTMNLIFEDFGRRDILGIMRHLEKGKSVAVVFVDFNEKIIKKSIVDDELNRIFNTYLVSQLG